MRGFKVVVVTLCMMLSGACAQFNQGTAAVPGVASHLDRIAARGELVVGMSGNQPPLNFISKSGELMGLEVDLAKQMADAMGVNLRIQSMAFADLLPALESGRVDLVLSGMTITPARNMKSMFVGPYFLSGKAILTREQTLADIRNPSEMNRPNLKIVALRGSTSQALVEDEIPDAKLSLAQDYDEAVQQLIRNEADIFIADYPICIISVFRYPDEGLISLITPMTFEPLGIGLPAGDPLYANWVENFLMLLDGSGELEELTNRWLGESSWLEDLP